MSAPGVGFTQSLEDRGGLSRVTDFFWKLPEATMQSPLPVGPSVSSEPLTNPNHLFISQAQKDAEGLGKLGLSREARGLVLSQELQICSSQGAVGWWLGGHQVLA